jgi:hypothetical protein
VISGESFADRLSSSFSALKQNLGGQKFKDDSEAKTVVAGWLIAWDID